ncbi:MAG: hypothetical protein ACK50A_16915 [Sphingobacteriaceae bacterium]
MKAIIHIFFLILFIPITLIAQNKIILKYGHRKAKIKSGMRIGVTKKGESFYYKNFTSGCTECYSDTACKHRIWTVENIANGYLILTKPIVNDTVKSYTRYLKQKILIDSVESFSFSRSNSCSGFSIFVPVFAAFVIVAGVVISIVEMSLAPLVIFEPVGLVLSYLMYRRIKDGQVRTYNTKEWKVILR